VTDADSATPIADVDLDCFDSLGRRIDITARTQADGTYLYGSLAPGSYFLRADPSARQGRLEQYYQNQSDIGQAMLIDVAAGSDTSGINFAIEPAGWIEGVVMTESSQPLAGIDLDLFASLVCFALAIDMLHLC